MSGFLDTNILIYAITQDRRTATSVTLIDGINQIGVQSLNEFANVCRRRLRMDWADIQTAVDRLRRLCPPPVPLTVAVHEAGLRLAVRHNLATYDAMIVAAALAADCETLWSEDMHDGLFVDGWLTIRNPFA